MLAPAPAPPETPASDEIAVAIERARPMLERQIEILGELAEIGLEAAREVQALARQSGGHPQVLAMAHGRVSRAVRQAVMLRAKLIDELIAYQARGAEAVAAVRRRREQARKAGIEAVVERVAKARGEDDHHAERLACEAGQRLDDDELCGDVLSRPMSEIVAEICRDLDLDPDWARLAGEAWARAEIDSGAAGWPLAELHAHAASPAGGRGGPRSGGEGVPPPPRPTSEIDCGGP